MSAEVRRRHTAPNLESHAAVQTAFHEAWDHYSDGSPRPERWRWAINHYRREGIGAVDISDAVKITFERSSVPPESRFAYICGILRKRVAATATQHRLNRLIDARPGPAEVQA